MIYPRLFVELYASEEWSSDIDAVVAGVERASEYTLYVGF